MDTDLTQATRQAEMLMSKGIDLATVWGPKLIAALLILIVGKWLSSRVSGGVRAAMKRSKIDDTLTDFAANFAQYAVLLLIGLGMLQFIGIEMTSVVAILGAAGFAVGLALQGTLSNFSAGVMLLLFRPYNVGDVIEANGVVGAVRSLGIFSTTLVPPDNVVITVPNGSIFGSVIKNLTSESQRRVDVGIGVAYDSDLDASRAALEGALKEIPGVLAEPAPAAYLIELGGSSMDFQMRAWCAPADYWAVREMMLQRGKEALDAAGISIPFPNLELHVLNTPESRGEA